MLIHFEFRELDRHTPYYYIPSTNLDSAPILVLMAILFVLVLVAGGLSLLALDQVYMYRQAARARRDALPVGYDVQLDRLLHFAPSTVHALDEEEEDEIFTTTTTTRPVTRAALQGKGRRIPYRSHQ